MSWTTPSLLFLLAADTTGCSPSRSRKEARILVIGLDGAGKTTLLYRYRLEAVVTTIPTIGFNVETIKVKGMNFTMWDIGGQDRIRPLWRHYYANTQGLLYVVDSADGERLLEARDELHRILEADDMKGAPLVVLANKQDLPGAAGESEITEQLELNTMSSRSWHVQPTSATSGNGISEGLEMMAAFVKGHKKTHRV